MFYLVTLELLLPTYVGRGSLLKDLTVLVFVQSKSILSEFNRYHYYGATLNFQKKIMAEQLK